MNVVVFVGPSVPPSIARALLPSATYLPPARQADLVSAVEVYRPDVIGVIDGAFGQASSVWHKEILFALERGVRVFGAASMGALRAVELGPFGMIGVGEIYRLFASAELADDDEVAVAHASAADDYRPLSLAMVNLRASLSLARAMHVVSDADEQLFIATAKSLYFADRTLAAIFARAAAQGLPTASARRLGAFLDQRYVDLKRRDAEHLLRLIRDLPPAARLPPTFVFERSLSFETLYDNDRRVRHADGDVPLSEVATRAALHLEDFDAINAAALNRALVQILADHLDVMPTEADIDAEVARLRSGRGLATDAALEEWLRSNGLSRETFAALMRELATCRRLHRWLIERDRGAHHARWILDELRLRGAYPGTVEAAAQQASLLAAWNLETGQEMLPDDVDLAALAADHRRATGWRLDVPLDVWAEEAGFETAQDLALALARAAGARERLRAAARALSGDRGVTPEDRPGADSAANASADCA